MFSNVLKSIEHISTYPLISLAIFVPFFIGVLIYVIRMKRDVLDEMSRLPLDNQQD